MVGIRFDKDWVPFWGILWRKLFEVPRSVNQNKIKVRQNVEQLVRQGEACLQAFMMPVPTGDLRELKKSMLECFNWDREGDSHGFCRRLVERTFRSFGYRHPSILRSLRRGSQ